jgi:hypothetical protein
MTIIGPFGFRIPEKTLLYRNLNGNCPDQPIDIYVTALSLPLDSRCDIFSLVPQAAD